ncbi:hypothetical protein EIN_316840 [Entamoeba invadens IP1]|uniref:USP domain-containing protein n=1 Tax=Entamoeba invadens IP1 TaxID=370355 RepID=A0A0A1TZE5_ENTIV|nr:hypothetical protein EIN_316840 [Entamoeba invadens IP1]ELP86965.1 hypothetical protein EIN_316840 [Entamoeba invadens IP1]|eukprot:XP_004253736.1 hypothetical protein EIN_316840 [Entamoeba invadens IP1]
MNKEVIEQVCGHPVIIGEQNDASLFIADILDTYRTLTKSPFFCTKIEKTMQCSHCGSTRQRVDDNFMITIGSEGAVKESLDHLAPDEQMELDCDICHCKVIHSIRSKTKASDTLLIGLNRVSNQLVKSDRYIEVPSTVYDYQITGMVIHRGTYVSGHYTTLARGYNDEWFWFNDSYVKKVNFDFALQLANGGNPNDWNAFVLLYEKHPTYSEPIDRVPSTDQMISKVVVHSVEFYNIMKSLIPYLSDADSQTKKMFLNSFGEVIKLSPDRDLLLQALKEKKTIESPTFEGEVMTLEKTNRYIKIGKVEERNELFILLAQSSNKTVYISKLVDYLLTEFVDKMPSFLKSMFSRANEILEKVVGNGPIDGLPLDKIDEFVLQQRDKCVSYCATEFYNLVGLMLLVFDNTKDSTVVIERMRPSSLQLPKSGIQWAELFKVHKLVLTRYYPHAIIDIQYKYLQSLLTLYVGNKESAAFVIKIFQVLRIYPLCQGVVDGLKNQMMLLEKTEKVHRELADEFRVFITTQESYLL